MDQPSLQASSRTRNGKGVARSLRREGRVPAVLYGHSRSTQALSVDHKALGKLLEIIGGDATLINVVIDNAAPVTALVREVQRNPVKRSELLHLDLYAVLATEPINLEIPIHLVGTPEGVRTGGGVLDHHIHRLPIRVLPSEIIERLEVDVSTLGVGDAIHVRDLKLAHGSIMLDPDVPVASVVTTRAEVADTAAAAVTAEPEVLKKGKAESSETADQS